MSAPSSSLSVVFAAYNEELNVEPTLRRARASLEARGGEWEILVVDDASQDGTSAALQRCARDDARIRVLTNEVNLGQGASLLKGFEAARLEWVTHNAMDYPFAYDELERVNACAEGADIVVVKRHQRPGYTRYRLVLSSANRLALRLAFRLPVSDCNFVQFFRREVLQVLPTVSTSTGFVIPSLLIHAVEQGYVLREVVGTYHARERGVATAGRPKVVFDSARELAQLWWRRRRRRKA